MLCSEPENSIIGIFWNFWTPLSRYSKTCCTLRQVWKPTTVMLLCSVLIGRWTSLPFNDSGQQCNKAVGEMKCRFELQFCQQPHFSFLFLITQHWMQAMKNWLSQNYTEKESRIERVSFDPFTTCASEIENQTKVTVANSL